MKDAQLAAQQREIDALKRKDASINALSELLAAIATVIASQAVITGAYSLTRQAIQLGLMPRFEIRHTSESQSGQIFIPRINRYLLSAVILLVLMFNHGGHGDDGFCCGLEGLEMDTVGGRRAHSAVSLSGSYLPGGEPPEGLRRGLGAARARHMGDAVDVHLAARLEALV